MEDTLVAKLRAIPIFADLDDDALARVGAVVTEFEAPAGHVLTQSGQEGSGMFILEEGVVTVEAPAATSRVKLGTEVECIGFSNVSIILRGSWQGRNIDHGGLGGGGGLGFYW